jgi:uncharacterized protein YdaU (DUF1376 family)
MQGSPRVNGLPYYKAYPRDFFEGTRGMDGELKGAYRMVLDLIYQHGGRLYNDPGHIAGQLGYSVRKWHAILAKLVDLGKLQIGSDGEVSNYRADKELLQLELMQSKQRENGSKPKKTNGIPKATAEPKRNHTEPEPEPDKKEKKEIARKRARDPEIPLPDDWVPSDRNIADAEARSFSQQEIHDEADRFRDHHLARGTRFRSWDAAWRTWLGNARRFANGRVVVTPFPRGGGQGRSLASIAAQRRASDPY